MKNKLLDSVLTDLQNTPGIDPELLTQNLEKLSEQKLNILFVGATGVGKSSTINAIFNTEVAAVGRSMDPETASIQKFEMDNLVLWDTPGLGDNPESDRRYAGQIANALKARDEDGNLIIDEVVVLVDGSSRDMKTTYEVIEQLVFPYVSDPKRIVIAINQCDMALKGRYWNHDRNQPDTQLALFLEQKVSSVRERLQESVELSSQPVYYSALYRYNISKLLLSMLMAIPEEKRFLLSDSLNKDPDVWKTNDELANYNASIQKELKLSFSGALDKAAKGALAGATIGTLVPVIGPVVGAAVGAALGFLEGLFS